MSRLPAFLSIKWLQVWPLASLAWAQLCSNTSDGGNKNGFTNRKWSVEYPCHHSKQRSVIKGCVNSLPPITRRRWMRKRTFGSLPTRNVNVHCSNNTCKYSYVPSSIPSTLVPDSYILLGGTTWMQQLCVELTRIDLLSGTTDGKEPAKLSVLRHSPWPEAKLFNCDPNAPPAPPFVGSTPKELEESLRGPPGAQVQL